MGHPPPAGHVAERIPSPFLMPRSHKIGVWRLDDFELWAWRCARCTCVGARYSHADAVAQGLAHLDEGCRRPRFKAVR